MSNCEGPESSSAGAWGHKGLHYHRGPPGLRHLLSRQLRSAASPSPAHARSSKGVRAPCSLPAGGAPWSVTADHPRLPASQTPSKQGLCEPGHSPPCEPKRSKCKGWGYITVPWLLQGTRQAGGQDQPLPFRRFVSVRSCLPTGRGL